MMRGPFFMFLFELYMEIVFLAVSLEVSGSSFELAKGFVLSH